MPSVGCRGNADVRVAVLGREGVPGFGHILPQCAVWVGSGEVERGLGRSAGEVIVEDADLLRKQRRAGARVDAEGDAMVVSFEAVPRDEDILGAAVAGWVVGAVFGGGGHERQRPVVV